MSQGPELDRGLPGTNILRGITVTQSAARTNRTSTRSTRIGSRRKLNVPGRLTWRDASGTLRFVSVVTRDVSDTDAFVDCQVPASIPLYRLVHFQIERSACDRSDLPRALRQGKLLSAVYRVGPYASSTGTPQGYALRLLVEPTIDAARVQPTATVGEPGVLAVAN